MKKLKIIFIIIDYLILNKMKTLFVIIYYLFALMILFKLNISNQKIILIEKRKKNKFVEKIKEMFIDQLILVLKKSIKKVFFKYNNK